MADNGEERRFNETEFGLILKRAIELDAESAVVPRDTPPPRLPPEGLTLSEVQEIAAEVGIDPVRVSDAVASIWKPPWSPLARLFGGPAKMSGERSLSCFCALSIGR